MKEQGWLSDQEYRESAERVPFICVDLIVLNDDKRVLLVKRKIPPYQGEWAVLGGRVRRGEELEEAVVRHISDLGVRGVEVMQPFSFERPAIVDSRLEQDPRFHAVTLYYPLKITSWGREVVQREFSIWSWFNLDELPDDVVPHHRRAIERVVELVK